MIAIRLRREDITFDVSFSDDEGEHWTTIGQGLPPVSKGAHYRNLREDAVAAR